MFDAVIFDLDGTLTDPAVGILGSFRHALAAVDHPVEDDVDLSWMIGPPIRDNFTNHGLPTELHDAAVAAYMDRHQRVGLFEATLHEGIRDLLDDLRAARLPLAVATLKPTDQAEVTLDHFGLRDRFDLVLGREPEMHVADKFDLVARAVAGLGGSAPVMVGDRIQDIEAGKANATATIAVAWGYAQPGEFDELAPDHTAFTVAGLRALLLP